MHLQKVTLLTLFMLLSGVVVVQATDLQVHLLDGPQHDIAIDDIRNIIYHPTTNAIEVNLTNGAFEDYYLEEIRKLTFAAGHITEVVMPETCSLLRNYPNPFNSTTTIEYQLAVSGEVQVAIYNIQGQLVRQLVDGYLQSGLQRFSWNGTGDDGSSVASGFYICHVKQGEEQLFQRMLLLK